MSACRRIRRKKPRRRRARWRILESCDNRDHSRSTVASDDEQFARSMQSNAFWRLMLRQQASRSCTLTRDPISSCRICRLSIICRRLVTDMADLCKSSTSRSPIINRLLATTASIGVSRQVRPARPAPKVRPGKPQMLPCLGLPLCQQTPGSHR